MNPLELDDVDLLTFVRGRIFSRDHEDLSDPEKRAYALIVLEDQVCNGGFVQYFCNTGGEFIGDAEDCARQIGAYEVATLISKAKILHAQQEPSVKIMAANVRTPEDYQHYRIANLSMEDLDGPFYDHLADLDTRLATFVRKNLVHFV